MASNNRLYQNVHFGASLIKIGRKIKKKVIAIQKSKLLSSNKPIEAVILNIYSTSDKFLKSSKIPNFIANYTDC